MLLEKDSLSDYKNRLWKSGLNRGFMKRYLRLFFNNPSNRDELLLSESIGVRLVNIIFLCTSLFIFITWASSFQNGVGNKKYLLSSLIFINGVAYLWFSIKAHYYAKHVFQVESLDDLKNMKLNFYKNYLLIIGTPYMALLLWCLVDYNLAMFLKMSGLLLVVVLTAYYLDWKRFVRSRKKYSDFFDKEPFGV